MYLVVIGELLAHVTTKDETCKEEVIPRRRCLDLVCLVMPNVMTSPAWEGKRCDAVSVSTGSQRLGNGSQRQGNGSQRQGNGSQRQGNGSSSKGPAIGGTPRSRQGSGCKTLSRRLHPQQMFTTATGSGA